MFKDECKELWPLLGLSFFDHFIYFSYTVPISYK